MYSVQCFLSVIQNQSGYSQDVGRYPVQWSRFTDPHSGLAYFRLGLGSSPAAVDIHPYVYVGLQTCECWFECPLSV